MQVISKALEEDGTVVECGESQDGLELGWKGSGPGGQKGLGGGFNAGVLTGLDSRPAVAS